MTDGEKDYLIYILKQWVAGNLYLFDGQFYDVETNEPTGVYMVDRSGAE